MLRSPFPLAALLVLLLAPTLSASAVQDIIDDYETTELTADQAALYLAQSVISPEALPSGYEVAESDLRCGFGALHEAHRLLDDVSEAVRIEILTLLARPTLSGPEYTFDSPLGYFKIHWTDQGEDATTQAYCEVIAEAADVSWEAQCIDMGYNEPPSDQGLGGDEKYDIYVMNISPLGYCSHAGEPGDPGTPNNDSASHIAIDIGLGTNIRKVTTCHEFQHAVQMAYDVDEPVWFMENCAVWMEDMVYDEIDDYITYLSGESAIRRPWYDIRSGPMYYYGASIWPRYMWLKINAVAVREVWEGCADTLGMNMLSSQQGMFASHGLTFERAFMQYGWWRWFTSTNWYSGCGYFDDEAQEWGAGPYVFAVHNISTLPDTVNEISADYDPERFGIHWIKVDLTDYQDGWVTLSFDGRDNFEWNLASIMWDEAGASQCQWHDVPQPANEMDLAVECQGWDYVIFFPAFMSETSLTHYYEGIISYSTGIEDGAIGGELADLNVLSNPMGPNGSVELVLPAGADAQLVVHDLTGRKISTVCSGYYPAGTYSISLGELDLAAGTYFITLYADNQIVTRKACIGR